MDATTPIEITREIVAVSELLYTAAPLYVPVVSDPQGVHGACFRSVLNKIKVTAARSVSGGSFGNVPS